MHLQLVDELQPVLDLAQEAIRLGEGVGVAGIDVATRRHVTKRVERRGAAQRAVETSVDELEELHRELDVADAAASTLHLTVLEALADHLLLRACFHRAHRPQIIGTEAVPPQM